MWRHRDEVSEHSFVERDVELFILGSQHQICVLQISSIVSLKYLVFDKHVPYDLEAAYH